MTKSTGFRSWYYFRIGWSTYFAFIFAAINTLTVTYYLAIERYPPLQEIFPNFIQYVVIITVIGIPILVTIGYFHYKKTKAFKSEVDVVIESNPYQRRQLVNVQIILMLTLKLYEMTLRLSKEKLTEQEIDEISKLHNELKKFVNARTFPSNKDMEFLRREILDV